MAYKILILGASYGSLLGTKLLMAGHDVTLVCRSETAAVINGEGTNVQIKLRGEDSHRHILSGDQPGNLDAQAPGEVDLAGYDMVALAMAEPQYGSPDIRALMKRIGDARLPCLSIMNMPPLAYLKRIEGLNANGLESAYNCPDVWKDFDPEMVTLCSPDPQAYRLPDAGPNVLHVGLPTNFKAARFANGAHQAMLLQIEADIAAVRLDGQDVPVKLRVFDSLFVPFAKWSMLLTGNYRCVLSDGERSIKDAVHGDIEKSRGIYGHVESIVRHFGADADDLVPFEKYAKAAENLLKPSSAARSIASGALAVERVDFLVNSIAEQIGKPNADIANVVNCLNDRLAANKRQVA